MRKPVFTLALAVIGILVLMVSSLLVFQEWSPEDDSAATIYYLSPNGSDSNPGTTSSPWKTLVKADASASPGDTVVLKDGVYSGYITLRKSNVTWRAENKHKAIIDGGFAPGMLNNNWNNIVSVWNTKCSNKGMFAALLAIRDADHVTIDGLFIRNSCGRGIGVSTSTTSATANNITIKNSMIDWTSTSGIYAEPAFSQKDVFQTKMNNFQFIDNVMTRTSIGDEYNVRVAGACQPKTTPENEKIKKYCVNISASFGGVNSIIRGNVFAWGEGELAPQPGSKGFLFENNVVVGNKNSFYAGMVQDAIARNNTFYAPELKKPKAGGDEDSEATGYWRLGLRNEKGHTDEATTMNTNIAIYNNLIVNMGFFITGTNGSHIGDNRQIYFGNNTLVAGKELDSLLHIQHGGGSSGDGVLTGIMENNIFDRRKNPSARINVQLSGNDQFLRRNNILPTNVDNSVKGTGDVYTNDPGLVNSLIELNLVYPNIGPETLDIAALRAALDINNYRLKQNSPAINTGSNGTGANQTNIPQLVRSQDFLRNTRTGTPDIGAIEFGGVYNTSTPTPIQSATPTQTPGASLTPTLTRTPGPSITPSTTPTPSNALTPVPSATPTLPVTGNICGKADVDGDGKFSIADFAEFAKSYGTGKNTCADKDVEYGSCGGRDVNRDGKLNIADFGAAGIGFAQRYYPKTSCAL
ncbi:MAG TPA: hypothetical protein PKU78_01415 [Candidatus Dojkabacteria bacterium]|nr:hypothetical protein [Candidatus Dojkabacteria bacterium]HRO64859.1 hypothetical protein [Candidatus Dojkabacteria bacterium]HRP51004.1 hypothetical protein [Candidatus Dojkabacteria bacterium]